MRTTLRIGDRMADFKVNLDGRMYHGLRFTRYEGYSKDAVIKRVKADADRMYADEFSIEYKSGKPVGRWVKKGTRWYRW